MASKKRWDVLVNVLKNRPHKVGAEVGVFRGRNAGRLLAGLPGLERLYCVDTWESCEEYQRVRRGSEDREAYVLDFDEIFACYKTAVAPYGERAVALRMSSEEAAQQVPDESLDFVFIDANHAYEYVKQDIELWMPKLRPGGLVSGHDYENDTTKPSWGVKKAVDEAFGNRAVVGADRTWYAFKADYADEEGAQSGSLRSGLASDGAATSQAVHVSDEARAIERRRRTRKLALLLILVLGGVYGALQNGKWVPSNDGEVYLSVARSLANGEGFMFNGYPVASMPPGWPAVLAAAMKICAGFWFINLLPVVFMVGAAVFWYLNLCRFSSPKRSFFIVLACGTLYATVWVTNAPFTDPLFCLLLGIAVMMAFQVNDGKDWRWRAPLLVLLCASLVCVRWTGILGWWLVGGALLTGQMKPRLNRLWVIAFLSGLAALVTFVGLRRAEASEYSDVLLERTELAGRTAMAHRVLKWPRPFRYARNFSDAGAWVACLLWAPAKLGYSAKIIAILSNMVGWVIVILFLQTAYLWIRKKHWVWLGVLVYCCVLWLRWSKPNDRYLVPVATFLLLGIWQSLGNLRSSTKSAWRRRLGKVGIPLLFGSIVTCSAFVFVTGVAVAHSKDFYGAYQAGRYKEMIAAAHYLNSQGVEDGDIVVNQVYAKLSRKKRNTFGLRTLSLLVGKKVEVVPKRVCEGRPNQELTAWFREKDAKYYVYNPPSPWRVWHFRIEWVEKMLSKDQVEDGSYTELYDMRGEIPLRIYPPDVSDWPKCVPYAPGCR